MTDISLRGCSKSVDIRWETCWRTDGTAGWDPPFDESQSFNMPSGPIGTYGGWKVAAWIRYLSCENSIWVAHKLQRGIYCRELPNGKLLCD